ncbi:hypothetical protein BGZ51_002402 [Haplosporangium sp. Z 767]|nr:hypothetical protein BGZ51_002402 [Haplosporangium sp. Z 767]
MLSTLSHSSISSTSAGDSSSNNNGCATAVQQYNGPQDHCNVSGGMVRETPLNGYSDHRMDYVIESPIHPLIAGPCSSPPNCPGTSSPTATYLPQQHQQIVKLKSEHGLQQPRRMSRADVAMTENSAEEPMNSINSSPVPLKPQSEVRDDGALSSQLCQDSAHPSSDPNQLLTLQERDHQAVDSSTKATHVPSSSKNSSATSTISISTPNTASLTPDSAPTGISSRRSSLRPMPATLPRSALQEETVALFKQYRHLIPCAKCFSRNTIQRDGMSDGNLRFKCRPQVSMSLICNKSYSESKIRHMIAGVVYGHTLPNSISASSENVLAMAPPPTTTKSTRRPSQKNEDTKLTSAALQQLQEEQEHGQQRQMKNQENTDIADPAQQSFEEMNINGAHPHPMDDNRLAADRWQGDGDRRSSLPSQQHRRPLYVSQDSPMMDYEDSITLPPPNPFQMSGAPPLENEIPRRYTSSGPHSSSTPTHRLVSKLHHSQSHPNIGQQRQQQYLEQQEQLREHRGSVSEYSSQNQQCQYQQQLQRQVLRRESSHHQRSQYPRPEPVERRYSHPAVLQPSSSSSSKYFPGQSLSNNTTSPALSSSPRYEPSSQHPLATSGNTPHMGSLPGPDGRYEETNISKSYYQRRMSQPIAYSCQLPPPPSGTYFDRRASDVEEAHSNYQLREKYERLNASTLRQSKSNRILSQQQQYSPRMASFVEATATAMERDTKFEHRGDQDFSGTRHAYQTFYQQPSRSDLDLVDSHLGNSPQNEGMPEDADYHSYSRMRSSFKRTKLGHPLSRSGSHPNLSSNTSNSTKDLTSAMPRNTIKLTCFPNAISSSSPSSYPSEDTAASAATTMDLNTKNALAMRLCKSSKVVIEITQPQGSQAFESSASTHDSRYRRSSLFSGFEDVPQPLSHQQQSHRHSLRYTASQPNLALERSTTSVLGCRRSVSPDDMMGYNGYGASKKRRADSLSNARDDDEAQASASASAAAAEAAAAAVVAAAANAARRQMNANVPITATSPSSTSLAGGLQIIGVDYANSNKTSPSKEIGLGVHVHTEEGGDAPTGAIESPTIEALGVAMASSYVKLEDQKEMGIDYSLFTRVETAGWRILIPPTVTASFLSDDFGLTLKPKVGANVESSHLDGQLMDVREEAMTEEPGSETMGDEQDVNDGAKVERDKLQMVGQENVSVLDTVTTKDAKEMEHEMDELEDE